MFCTKRNTLEIWRTFPRSMRGLKFKTYYVKRDIQLTNIAYVPQRLFLNFPTNGDLLLRHTSCKRFVFQRPTCSQCNDRLSGSQDELHRLGSGIQFHCRNEGLSNCSNPFSKFGMLKLKRTLLNHWLPYSGARPFRFETCLFGSFIHIQWIFFWNKAAGGNRETTWRAFREIKMNKSRS